MPLKTISSILLPSFNLKVIFSFSHTTTISENNRPIAFSLIISSNVKTIRNNVPLIVGKSPPPQSRKWPARFPGPIGVDSLLCLFFYGARPLFVCLLGARVLGAKVRRMQWKLRLLQVEFLMITKEDWIRSVCGKWFNRYSQRNLTSIRDETITIIEE